MIQMPTELKKKVVEALMVRRQNYDGNDAQFAKQWEINSTVFSRLKGGEIDGLLRESQWVNIARELDVSLNARTWTVAKTDVFVTISQDIKHCQRYAKSLMCVDDCGIGKTFTAKYLSATLKNCFYVDGSQAKEKTSFIRLLAKTIGVDDKDKLVRVKANIKYALKMLPNPIVIIDEVGDLSHNTFLELKEFWNATVNACGWYLMGADGLRDKIERGIGNKKVGYAEIFSRFGERYTSPVPSDRKEKIAFYKKLITDVLTANMQDKSRLNEIVRRCLTTDETGQIGGLRRAEDLLILTQNSNAA